LFGSEQGRFGPRQITYHQKKGLKDEKQLILDDDKLLILMTANTIVWRTILTMVHICVNVTLLPKKPSFLVL